MSAVMSLVGEGTGQTGFARDCQRLPEKVLGVVVVTKVGSA
jgi:hypothetical protein